MPDTAAGNQFAHIGQVSWGNNTPGLRLAWTQVKCSPRKPVQNRQTKFIRLCPTWHWIDSGGNVVRETSRTGLPWLIPAMSIRTRWLGNGDWPSFKSGALLDTNVSRQLQQQHNFKMFWRKKMIEIALESELEKVALSFQKCGWARGMTTN